MVMLDISSDDGSQPELTLVRACVHCGHPRLREEVENREITPGYSIVPNAVWTVR